MERQAIYILDKNGTIVTDKLYKNRTGFHYDDEHMSTLTSSKKGKLRSTIRDQKQNIYFVKCPQTELIIVQHVPLAIMYKERNMTFVIFMIIASITAVLATICSILLSSSISKPVKQLSRLMKKVEQGNRDIDFNIDCDDEIEQIQNYLTIQKIRFHKNFEALVEVEEAIYNHKILRLVLQPIVENAIIHGLEPKIGKGKLIIKGYKDQENIIFDILDDGIGMGNSKSKGEGIGMSNVMRRIQIYYGEQYGIIIPQYKGFTCVRIIIPTDRIENKAM